MADRPKYSKPTKLAQRVFPGGPVVRTQHFYHYGLGSIPALGTEMSYIKPLHTAAK